MLAGQRFTAGAKTRRQRRIGQRTRLFAQHPASAFLMQRRGPTRRTAVKVPLEVGLFFRRQLAVDIGSQPGPHALTIVHRRHQLRRLSASI